MIYATNKHLLPVYAKPMIFYPISNLVRAEIKEIIVLVSGRFLFRLFYESLEEWLEKTIEWYGENE